MYIYQYINVEKSEFNPLSQHHLCFILDIMRFGASRGRCRGAFCLPAARRMALAEQGCDPLWGGFAIRILCLSSFQALISQGCRPYLDTRRCAARRSLMRKRLAQFGTIALLAALLPAGGYGQGSTLVFPQHRQQAVTLPGYTRQLSPQPRYRMEEQRRRQQATVQLRKRALQDRQRGFQVQADLLAQQRRADQKLRLEQQRPAKQQAEIKRIQRDAGFARERERQFGLQRRLQEFRLRTQIQASDR
jgi:hypothetical protein